MNFFEKYLKLRSVAPFDSIDADAAAAIADICEERSFAPSAIVAPEGGLPTHFFIVFEGWICSENGGREKLFNLKKLIDMSEYSENFRASKEEGARCLVMTREHFQGAIKNCPEILSNIARRMAIERKGGGDA